MENADSDGWRVYNKKRPAGMKTTTQLRGIPHDTISTKDGLLVRRLGSGKLVVYSMKAELSVTTSKLDFAVQFPNERIAKRGTWQNSSTGTMAHWLPCAHVVSSQLHRFSNCDVTPPLPVPCPRSYGLSHLSSSDSSTNMSTLHYWLSPISCILCPSESPALSQVQAIRRNVASIDLSASFPARPLQSVIPSSHVRQDTCLMKPINLSSRTPPLERCDQRMGAMLSCPRLRLRYAMNVNFQCFCNSDINKATTERQNYMLKKRIEAYSERRTPMLLRRHAIRESCETERVCHPTKTPKSPQ